MLAFPAAYQARLSWAALCTQRTGALSLRLMCDACALQEGGWLPGVFFTLLFMTLTVLTSTYLVKVVQHFKARAQCHCAGTPRECVRRTAARAHAQAACCPRVQLARGASARGACARGADAPRMRIVFRSKRTWTGACCWWATTRRATAA
jgi:hypothetical protein